MIGNTSNLAEHIDSCLADNNIDYSPDGSGASFISFYRQLGYSDKSVLAIERCVDKTHKLYPGAAWLNKAIKDKGLIAVGKTITQGSAHGTSYLHFLVITGHVGLSFYDYFGVNPKAMDKLERWLDASKARFGIDEFVEALLEVSAAVENHKINLEKMRKKVIRVGIYLVLRYQLKNIRSINSEQWRSFVLECRDHSRGTAAGCANNLAPVRHMHNALFNMGVLEEPYNRKFGGVKDNEKKREYLAVPGYGEFAKDFLAHIKPQVEAKTHAHYCTSLGLFYEFLEVHQGGNVNIGELTRADISAYTTFLFKEQKIRNNSFSWVEARSYNVKVFLSFIVTHSTEFVRRGLKVFKKKIVVDQDFHVPHVNGRPKDIEEPVRKALFETLKLVPSHRYGLTFRLMAHTGLALADVLCLKEDCISYDEVTKQYKFTVWRAKRKKCRVIKPMAETVKIVEQIKAINTQKVPTAHPDGSRTIFLLNNAGVPYGSGWFEGYFNQHKELAAKAYPELAAKIAKVTPHQLRHTFATMLRDMGVGIMQIKELLLHENISTTHKYTKESDNLKVALIKKLENDEYVCDEYPNLDQSYLNSEDGKVFIENLIKHENKFSYGRCTVDGFNNCSKAYRCLLCGYLCTTEEDLPEIIGAITIQHTRILKLDSDIVLEIDLVKLDAMKLEREKSKMRLVKLLQKLRKLQAKQPDLPDGFDDPEVGSDGADDGLIIEFV